MKITLAVLNDLRSAIENVTAAWEGIEDEVLSWTDLHEARDAESREERKDAEEAIESGLGELEQAARELVEWFA